MKVTYGPDASATHWLVRNIPHPQHYSPFLFLSTFFSPVLIVLVPYDHHFVLLSFQFPYISFNLWPTKHTSVYGCVVCMFICLINYVVYWCCQSSTPLSVNHVCTVTPAQQLARSWSVRGFVAPDSFEDPASLNQQSTQTDIEH